MLHRRSFLIGQGRGFYKRKLKEDELLGILHFDENISERSMGTNISRLETDNSEMEIRL